MKPVCTFRTEYCGRSAPEGRRKMGVGCANTILNFSQRAWKWGLVSSQDEEKDETRTPTRR